MRSVVTHFPYMVLYILMINYIPNIFFNKLWAVDQSEPRSKSLDRSIHEISSNATQVSSSLASRNLLFNPEVLVLARIAKLQPSLSHCCHCHITSGQRIVPECYQKTLPWYLSFFPTFFNLGNSTVINSFSYMFLISGGSIPQSRWR